jgi:hypothetical protein
VHSPSIEDWEKGGQELPLFLMSINLLIQMLEEPLVSPCDNGGTTFRVGVEV